MTENTMADSTTCSCGCGALPVVHGGAACRCGCSCCDGGKNPEQEIAELQRLRDSAEQRLAELGAR